MSWRRKSRESGGTICRGKNRGERLRDIFPSFWENRSRIMKGRGFVTCDEKLRRTRHDGFHSRTSDQSSIFLLFSRFFAL